MPKYKRPLALGLHRRRISRHREAAIRPARLRLPHVEARLRHPRTVQALARIMAALGMVVQLPAGNREAWNSECHPDFVLPGAARAPDAELLPRAVAKDDVRIRLVGPCMVYLLRVWDGYRQVWRILEGERHGPYLAVVVVLVEVWLLAGLEADEPAHRLVGRDPWPAGHRPPGAVLHLELKPAPVALRLGELDEINPVLAQARNHVRNAGPWFVLRPAAVEELDS